MRWSIVMNFVLGSLLIMALCYIAFNFEDLGLGTVGYDEVAYPPPETVKLPYSHIFGKGNFRLDITAVPERPNEIRIFAHASGIRTSEKREWIQQGPCNIVFNLEGGKDKFFLDISELKSDDHEVKSVKVSLRLKYISGPR